MTEAMEHAHILFYIKNYIENKDYLIIYFYF